jgi:hypothetical protein
MISQADRLILRDLAKRVAEIAALPEMAEKRALWKRHNRLQPMRPLVLVFPEGSWGELLPPASYRCAGELARRIEADLRMRVYTYEHFKSDNVVDNSWVVGKVIENSGWGMEARYHQSTEARGSYSYDPVITSPADLRKLRFPEISYAAEKTQRNLAEMQELFGDIFDVQLKGITHISFHLMALYCGWRGLEQVMLDMYEEPTMLHDAMAFLEEGHQRMIRQYSALNLFSLNNDGTYHSSGGVGYSDELPTADCDPAHIRPCDMWSSAEAQEMAQVSPAMHAEFILPYEKRLLAHFGLNGYGCCEDLTHKLDDVFTIPHIRRISIAPWANVDSCAEKLQDQYIFSWKPNPAYLVGHFDLEQTRRYVVHTIKVTKDCVLEIILKDTHTCENHPERFEQWSAVVDDLVKA